MAVLGDLLARVRRLIQEVGHWYGINKYEAQAICERFLLTMFNQKNAPLSPDVPFRECPQAEQKFYKEIAEKARRNRDRRRVDWKEILTTPQKPVAGKVPMKGERAEAFVSDYGEHAFASVALQYEILGNAGAQWGIPQQVYDKLSAVKLGDARVTLEGFASPLNSRLRGKPGCGYCSILPADAKYGSEGDFFDVAPRDPSRIMTVNPPYIESIMERACELVLAEGIRGLVMLPRWTDTPAHKMMTDAGWTAIAMRDHLLEKPSGETFRARHVETIFVHPECPDIHEIVLDWRDL